MSNELARLLNLETAWKRVKHDIKDRAFIRNPYAVPVIEFDLAGWLRSCLDSIRKDEYRPSAMFVCDVPKSKGLIRPGSHISFKDRLIFTACLGACFPAIHERLSWSQGSIDFAYQLAPNPDSPEWLRYPFTGWKRFQDKSLEAINGRTSHVVIADIASFYENIDIALLLSDLRDAHAPEPAVVQIGECLNRWAQVAGRGIPQGMSASHILAKLYLNNIDHVVRDMGYVHLRYVDDLRAFCTSRIEAKKLLVELSTLLRKRGLNLQAAKSEIYDANAARRKIGEVTAVLTEVQQRFITDVVDETGEGDPYMSVREADKILDENPEEAPLEIIEEAYRTYVVENPKTLKGTLFRFLLSRLGKQRDSFAVEHCMTLLEPYPEETENILSYFASVGPGANIESRIVDLMHSGQLVYDYQIYQIVEWFYGRSTAPSERLAVLVRGISFDGVSPRYLKTICRAFLGKFGNSADIERIASLYDQTNDPSERGEIICSIGGMERARRNAFLARVQRDGGENVRAIGWIKSQS